ncbi:MAG: hypothetical protein ABIJ18_05245 [archaeon]
MLLYENITLIGVVAGLVIIGVGILLGNIGGKLTRKLLESFEVDRFINKFPINDLGSSLVKFLIYISAVVWGIFQMGMEWIVLILVGFIVCLILIWNILMAIKDFVPNFISFLQKNQTIKSKHIKGRVIKRGVLESKIKSADGEILYIQNRFLK